MVLYGGSMEEGSRLEALSLLMKGETLPAWTHWQVPNCVPIENEPCACVPLSIFVCPVLNHSFVEPVALSSFIFSPLVVHTDPSRLATSAFH